MELIHYLYFIVVLYLFILINPFFEIINNRYLDEMCVFTTSIYITVILQSEYNLYIHL